MSGNNTNTSTASGGIGFTGLLGVLFIALKLCGVIDWPWVWVLAPVWIPFGIAVLVIIGVLISALFTEKKISIRRKKR